MYLRLQPYAQSSVVNRPCPKLALKFFGPFKVLSKIGAAAYKLELPKGSRVHPVFHVSQLKSHGPDHTPVFTVLPKPLDLSVPGVVPEQILDRRLVKKGNAAYVHSVLQSQIRILTHQGKAQKIFSTRMFWYNSCACCVQQCYVSNMVVLM